MRLLITGVGGFLGRHLARRAVAAGHRVVGTYIEEPPRLPGVELIELEILDRDAVARRVEEAAPDAVIHLAGLSHVGESWQRMADYFRVNVLGSEHVLDALAASCSRGGCRAVLASSAEVYGVVPEAEQPIAEDRPPDPRTPYALTKAAAERIALHHGAVVARTFNLVGPGQSPRFALPAFAGQLAAIARGESIPVLRVGNLEARRDFVHVEDAAAAYLLLAERGEAGGVYNLASGQAHSIGEALDRLRAVSGVEARVQRDPARLRPVDIPLLRGDAGRLRRLGWSPQRDLEAALRDLWRTQVDMANRGGGACPS